MKSTVPNRSTIDGQILEFFLFVKVVYITHLMHNYTEFCWISPERPGRYWAASDRAVHFLRSKKGGNYINFCLKM